MAAAVIVDGGGAAGLGTLGGAVTAIQQPGHCLWWVGKPPSPQAPDE
nr:hypothetical protein [Kibdelosporangium sp. MJ126-NF4]CTQ98654.1 hypothetical protein [Kibdelosporangium sp. MJ126-NF4]